MSLHFLGAETLAVWDVADYDKVVHSFKQIREAITRNDLQRQLTLLEEFDSRLDRVYNDQTANGYEPLEVAKTKNRVVNDGLVRIAELVTGTVGLNSGFQTSTGYFSHFACGSGTNPVSASDYQLQAEIARVGISDSGYMTAAGQIMRFGGFFAPSTVSCTVNEAAVFDDPNSGIMLFRTVFPSGQGLTHTVNVDFFSCAHAVYAYSV